jgi:pimeloyl-ACP methyl ester carboxylesterase
MKARSNDGTAIAYESTGSGPGVVLVHGSAADHHDWDLVVPLLDGFTVHAMDRRGRGASADGPHSIAAEAEDVRAVLAATGARGLVGHSYGALCALEAAAGIDLDFLVLYEPPLFLTAPDAAVADDLDRMASSDPQGTLRRFLAEAGLTEEEVAAIPEAVWPSMLATAPTLGREIRTCYAYQPRAERCRRVAAPTLLLGGSLSPPFFGEALDRLHALLPNARRRTLEGEAHSAVTNNPTLIAQAIRDAAGF